MARVLFVWELGGQRSHLTNVEAVARELAGGRHVLGVALRELQHAGESFSGLRLQYYQAPFKQGEPADPIAEYQCYAHVLYASGFAEARELAVLVSAWRGIFDSFRPDVIVCDHSPAALLASRAYDVVRVLIGSGFLVPPATTPLGVFPPADGVPVASAEALQRDEDSILGVANAAGETLGIAPLASLAELYDCDERLLLTFPELDPFGARPSELYCGCWPVGERESHAWPAGAGPKVFVYLTDGPTCDAVLADLSDRDASVLLFAPPLSAAQRARWAGERVRLVERPADLFEVARHCDLLVSHGAHGSVAQTLVRGVPQLMIPIYKEQLLTALRVRDLGAGLAVPRGADCRESLDALLDDEAFAKAAREFATRHEALDAARGRRQIGERLRPYLG